MRAGESMQSDSEVRSQVVPSGYVLTSSIVDVFFTKASVHELCFVGCDASLDVFRKENDQRRNQLRKYV